MSTPRFSVVIPTRERADTLRHALRTCLDQAFDDYEVVVSDNFSSPATKAVVDELESPKVRYVRTAEPVAMSANWEFAVGHARGEFVTVLGDDDGLLPHALAEVDRLAREHNARAVRWSSAFYTWPNVILEGHGNYLRVPLGRALAECDGEKAIRDVAELREEYDELPSLYTAAVHRDVLAELRARGGRLFAYSSPDVYTGFTVAHAVGRFVSTTAALGIRGVSGSSNGVANLYSPTRTRGVQEFYDLSTKDGFAPLAQVPQLPALGPISAEAFLIAKREVFPDSKVTIDRKALSRSALAVRATEAAWPTVLAEVRRSLSDDAELVRWFDSELANTPYTPPAPPLLKPNELGFDGGALHLDVGPLGVTDVAGAALLCDQLLGYRNRAIRYTAAGGVADAARQITELAAAFGREGADLVRRALGWETMVNSNRDLRAERDTLLAVCAERAAIIDQADAQIRALAAQLQAERGWSLKRPLRGVKKVLAKLTKRAA